MKRYGLFGNRIGTKAMFCLLFPMLMNFMFLWQFLNVTNETNRIVLRERRLNDISTKMHTVILLAAGGLSNYLSFVGSGSTIQREEGERKLRKADQKMTEVETLSSDEPGLSQQFLHVRVILNKLISTIEKVGTVNPTNESSMTSMVSNFVALRPLIHDGNTLNEEATKIMNADLKTLDDLRVQEQVRHDAVIAWIYIGALANLFVAFGMMNWFIRNDLVTRLNILISNAVLLPRGLPLEKHVRGHDELADLDTVLHEAEQVLKDSAEQRTLLMEMVAHDMRSPLMSAQIALDLLTQLMTNASPAEQRQTAALKRNLEVVISLVTDLLMIDRLESGALELQKTRCELGAIVEDAILNVNALAGSRKIKLSNDCEEETYALIDADRILQVLTNLITNAIKFSPADSTIRITSFRAEPFAQLCVQDEGPGLPPGAEKKIFEKFHQVKSEHAKRGFGLGLTVCKMLVELHGGTIRAQNLPGKGTKFCFSVYLASDKLKEAS